jgi:hypothetical protein
VVFLRALISGIEPFTRCCSEFKLQSRERRTYLEDKKQRGQQIVKTGHPEVGVDDFHALEPILHSNEERANA